MARSRTLLIVLVAASLALVLLDLRSSTRSLRSVVAAAALPVERAATAVFRPVGQWAASIGTFSDPVARQERAAAIVDQLRISEQRAQDGAGAAEAVVNGRTTLPARVVGVPGSALRAWVTLDVGAGDGVEIGNAVLAPLGVIGTVREVTSGSCAVRLITDPGSSVGARVARSGEIAEATGAGGSSALAVTLLDPDADVRADDLLVTLGAPGPVGVPAGLPLASVTEVDPVRAEAGRRVAAEPTGSTTTVDLVAVLLRQGQR